MVRVGSKEIARGKFEDFLDAQAPMSAKCEISDALRERLGFNEWQAAELTAILVRRLNLVGYTITAKE